MPLPKSAPGCPLRTRPSSTNCSARPASRTDSETSQQVTEARVRSQGREPRIEPEIGKDRRPLLIRPLERFEGKVFFSERGIDQDERSAIADYRSNQANTSPKPRPASARPVLSILR